MDTTVTANGEPGAAALCSTPAAARAAAAAARACDPTVLTLHLGVDGAACAVLATGDADALVAALAPHADVALHRTATRRLLRHRRTWEPGEPTPGITQLYLTRRRDGLCADDYHRYWEREHGPRALRHHLGMWDYAQVSVVGTERGEPVDGLAVTQWATVADLEQRFTDGPVGDAVIRHDAGRFTHLGALARHRTVEHVLVDAPWPPEGTVEVTHYRRQAFDRSADEVWAVVGDFAGILGWWPPGWFAECRTQSAPGPGMTRTMVRADGSTVVERLLEHRPDERMMQLTVDVGMPPSIGSYTCRYEVRPAEGGGCHLDWYPRAVVTPEGVAAFGAVVDRGWTMVAGGLLGALA